MTAWTEKGQLKEGISEMMDMWSEQKIPVPWLFSEHPGGS